LKEPDLQIGEMMPKLRLDGNTLETKLFLQSPKYENVREGWGGRRATKISF
jgi:hypothetical protein